MSQQTNKDSFDTIATKKIEMPDYNGIAERHTCPRAVLYIFNFHQTAKTSKSDKPKDLNEEVVSWTVHDIVMAHEEEAAASRLYSHCQVSIENSCHVFQSPQIYDLSRAIEEVSSLRQFCDTKKSNGETTLVSLRLFFRPSAMRCGNFILNPHHHRCLVCDACYTEDENLQDTQHCAKFKSPMSNLDVRQNGKAALQHLSRAAHYRQGDSKAFPAGSIVKDADPPGKTLLREAFAPEYAEIYRELPEYQIFTADGARRKSRAINQRCKRLYPFTERCGSGLQECHEDQFDIQRRQDATFQLRHYTGPTRQDLFHLTSIYKGVSKSRQAALSRMLE